MFLDVLKNKDAVFLLKYWIAACDGEQLDDVVTGLGAIGMAGLLLRTAFLLGSFFGRLTICQHLQIGG